MGDDPGQRRFDLNLRAWGLEFGLGANGFPEELLQIDRVEMQLAAARAATAAGGERTGAMRVPMADCKVWIAAAIAVAVTAAAL